MKTSSTSSPFPGEDAFLSKRRATVARGFVIGILSGFARQGKDTGALLRTLGIDISDPDCRIPIDRYAALYNLGAAENNDEGFGLFSRAMPSGTFEFLCRSAISATTLLEALQRMCRFFAVVLPDFSISFERGANRAQLFISEAIPIGNGGNDPTRVFSFELILRSLHGVSSWLAGRGLVFDSVAFPYSRPDHADDYTLIYTRQFSFGADRLTAVFNANLLDLPIRRDETALTRFLDGAPGKITMLYRRDREMVMRVRDLLRSELVENLSLEEVAARLYLSSRTLSRRLEEENSNFRVIKNALRRDLAYSALTKTDKSVARIATDLGYADTSAFYRAFVSWSGMSPQQYRERLLR